MIKNNLLSQWFVIIPTVRISVTKRRFEANPIGYSYSEMGDLTLTSSGILEDMEEIYPLVMSEIPIYYVERRWTFLEKKLQIKCDFNPFINSYFKTIRN